MAKPRKKDDKVKALVVATLKRAIAVVEGSMADKSTKPAEGAYPVALELGITGDITVGAAVPAGEDREVPTLNAAQVLAGLVAAKRGPAARRKVIDDGVEMAAQLTDDDAIKAAVAETDELLLAACADAGLTKTAQAPARAGAVSGKPAVTVSGTHGTNPLEMEVEAS